MRQQPWQTRYMREFRAAPSALVEDGQVQLGTFSEPVSRVNLLDAPLTRRLPLPRPLRAQRLKEWQAYQLDSPTHFLCVALFNAKLLALAQVKLYDKTHQKKYLFERKLLPWRLTLPDNVLDSETRHRSRGCDLVFRNHLAAGRIELSLEVAASAELPRISGAIRGLADRSQPLVVSIPFGQRRGMYSHKCSMPANGQLSIGSDTLDLEAESCTLFMDDHKGYYPVVMRWDWLTGGGRDQEGRRIGFNLTRNQSIDQERYNENGVWIDGSLTLLPPVEFERRGRDSGEHWYVRDREGRVDLRFDVEMPSALDMSALLLRSRYRGPFGHISGQIDGHRLERAFGMGEDFYLRC